ncbi:inclusion body protein [Dyella sp. M7H15-1]|uniref:inclusion body family protein n=1 Tax=Dyella sp. M7H15-1 TaxID=2501295 RepID=UPI001005213A|nr:inclusion body family protein [Dyella sp. M7H15-1]QAU24172.1 inclusion body protein [Dyella sp. M7H15-1]
MSIVTDVLASIDTKAILDKYGPNNSMDNPPVIDPKYIYMTVTQGQVVSGQAGGELDVKAAVGDVVRWREASMSLGFEQQVIFYKFVGTANKELITAPAPREATVTVPVPNAQDPKKPNKQTVKNYFWTAETLSTGRVTYHFQFQILDRDGNLKGCYQWDPFITIRNS